MPKKKPLRTGRPAVLRVPGKTKEVEVLSFGAPPRTPKEALQRFVLRLSHYEQQLQEGDRLWDEGADSAPLWEALAHFFGDTFEGCVGCALGYLNAVMFQTPDVINPSCHLHPALGRLAEAYHQIQFPDEVPPNTTVH